MTKENGSHEKARKRESHPAMFSRSDFELLRENVARLAQFLSRPESLQEAIRNKYATSGVLPEDWQTLLELLPKSGPLLQVTGEQGKWLMDIHSMAPPPSPAEPAPPANEPAAPTSPEQKPPAETAPVEQKEVIEQKEAVEQKEVIEQKEAVEQKAPIETPVFEVQTAFAPLKQIQLQPPNPPIDATAPRPWTDAQAQAPVDAIGKLQEIIRTVQAVDQEIRNSTEERLNLDRIASELRILDISPPFEAFQSAARTLTESLRMPSQNVPPDCVSILTQYDANLRRGWGALLNAFRLAAFLNTASGRVLNPRSQNAALRFLSSELEFASLSTNQITEVLLDELRPHDPAKPPEMPPMPAPPQDDLGPVSLQKAWMEGAQLGYTERIDDSLDGLKRLYERRAHDLILHMRSGNRLPAVDRTELLLVYKGSLTHFSGDPNTIPLGDYARALAGANAALAEGFIMAALLKLGFVHYVRNALMKADVQNSITPGLWEDLREQSELLKDRSNRALIITGDPLPWPPSTRWAVVQLSPDLALKLETPRATVCVTGRDVDGETTIRLRKAIPGVKFGTLDEEAGNVDEAIRRALGEPSPKSGPSGPANMA